MNTFLHNEDYPETIALLDTLLLPRQVPCYVVEDTGRSIDWDAITRCMSSTESACLRAVEALCSREPYGGLPTGHPWSGLIKDYVVFVTAWR